MRGHRLPGLIIAGVVTLLHLLASRSETFTNLENSTLDLRFRLRGEIPRRAESDKKFGDIVVVAVDERTFKKLDINWPFPPSMHAKLITNLTEGGAAVIAWDNLHPQAAPGCLAEEEPALAAAVREAGNVIWGAKVRLDGELYDTPIPALNEACAGLGFLNMPEDRDGALRRTQPMVGETHSLALAIVVQDAGPEAAMLHVEPDEQYVINFRGGPGTYTTLSYADVYNNDLPDGFSFDGKYVLIGPSAPEMQDNKLHPFGEGRTMPGVEIHANIVDNLTTSRHWITEAPGWLDVLVLLAACALGAAAVLLLPPIWALVLVLLSALGYATLDYWLFASHDYALNLAGPLLAQPTVYIFVAAFRLISEQAARAHLRSTFSRYVSPDVVNELIQDPGKLKLGGDKKVLSVLFSDIRGFTSISEKMAPEELVPFLNEYLSAMSQCVLDKKGMLDKYIGDAIMAVWGAPLPNYEQAADACRAALAMRDKLGKLAPGWEERKLPPIRAGIGINTGPMIVGNIGSEQKMDFTVIGDNVNLASRLEGLTKQYRVEILISEFTREVIKDGFTVRLLDRVTVKGKEAPIGLFEVLAEGPPDDRTRHWIAEFTDGLDFFTHQNWTSARKAFEAVKAARGGKDGPSDVYIERIAVLQDDPPGEDWDGVWRWTTK